MDIFDQYKEADELIMLAEMANHMGRPEDVLKLIEKVIKVDPNLNPKARNLFSSASKNLIDHNRHALQIISLYSQNLCDTDTNVACKREQAVEYYKETGEQHVSLCERMISILEKDLIPNAVESSNKVFYLKWLGDCYRYQTEYEVPGESREVIEKAQEAYTAGMKEAEECLDATDYHRLGLALNYSVYLFEVCDCKDRACEVAEKTLNMGEEALAFQSDVSRDCEAVLRLLHDNLTIWKSQSPAQ